MKVTYPLSLKISLWLLLNLVLLAVAGGALYWTQFGRGWHSLTVGAVGERIQSVSDSIMAAVHAVPVDERAATLAARAKRHGVQLYVVQNDGTQLLGDATTLPAGFATELLRGNQRQGPPFGGKGPPRGPRGGGGDEPPPHKRGPPPGADEYAPKRGPLGNARPAGMGRFVVRAGEPAETWLGVRVPYQREDGPPLPSTLVIRAASIGGIVSLLDVAPWFGVIAGVFVLSVLFWLPLVAGITRALRQLTRATEAIAEGRFDTRVPDARRDELGQLGHSVNRMAARLDTLVNGQKRFLGDVAHELGSPLGRLQVATEILETRATPALRGHVADVRDEVQQMAALVNELLAFTKAGLRPRDAELKEVDVDALLTAVLAREDPAGRLARPAAGGLRVRADEPLLARALGNLVRNALRYAGPQATIALGAQRAGAQVIFVVEDDGPGVPADALARLGEPFYRPESARTRETGGVGLGLAIVRSAVAACGGEVAFATRTPHGFRATIRLGAP
jgi:two-component system sensor histidine kinase CpxA